MVGTWAYENRDALGIGLAVAGLAIALIALFVGPEKRTKVPGGPLAIGLFGVVVVVVGVALVVWPTSPPGVASAGSPSPSAAGGPTASQSGPTETDPIGCEWRSSPVHWDNYDQGQDGLPRTGHELNVEVGPCETVLLDGTRFSLEDGTACDQGGLALCVVVWQSSTGMSALVRSLDTASNYAGHTPSSYQYAIDDKKPTWWIFPNCGNGCDGAYVTVFVDGRKIQDNTYVPPRS